MDGLSYLLLGIKATFPQQYYLPLFLSTFLIMKEIALALYAIKPMVVKKLCAYALQVTAQATSDPTNQDPANASTRHIPK